MNKSIESKREEWPVKVFRRTLARGWEMYYDPEEQVQSESSAAAPEEQVQSNITAATPRKGCVEIKRLRIRINLTKPLEKEQQTQDSISPSKDKSNSSTTNNNTVVVRRLDTILLSTRKGGAVVLKFQNKGDCLAFSDRLVYLNSDLIPKPQTLPELSSTYDGRNKNSSFNYFQEKKESVEADLTTDKLIEHDSCSFRKRKRNDSVRDSMKNASTHSTSMLSLPACPAVTSVSEKRRDILSYIIRLLHDDDFLGFVDDIEESLKSSPDCIGILEALGTRESKRNVAST
jgi:hypothetical protein